MSSEEFVFDPGQSMRFERRINEILNTLQREYRKLRPEFGDDGLWLRVLDPFNKKLKSDRDAILKSNDKIDPQWMNTFALNIESDTLPVRLDVLTIHVACAYSVVSEWAYQNGEFDRAWCLLTDAALHLGWVFAIGLGEDVYDHELMKRVKSRRGTQAAHGAHKDTNEMKREAYEFVKEKGYFETMVEAGVAIEKMLAQRLPHLKPLKDPIDTITGWLGKMPGKEKYFGSLIKKSKKMGKI